MITTGKCLAETQVSAATVEEPKEEARTFKVGSSYLFEVSRASLLT